MPPGVGCREAGIRGRVTRCQGRVRQRGVNPCLDITLVKALAWAFRGRGMLETGGVATVREIAKLTYYREML